MDGVVSLLAEVSRDEVKIKDLLYPVWRGNGRKPSMTFLCRDFVSFIRVSPSVETDDFMARSN